MPFLRLLFFILIIWLFGVSCQSVKPYQRAYLNDRDMQFGNQTVEGMELKVHTYREGASGGQKGKSAGGCGCK